MSYNDRIICQKENAFPEKYANVLDSNTIETDAA